MTLILRRSEYGATRKNCAESCFIEGEAPKETAALLLVRRRGGHKKPRGYSLGMLFRRN